MLGIIKCTSVYLDSIEPFALDLWNTFLKQGSNIKRTFDYNRMHTIFELDHPDFTEVQSNGTPYQYELHFKKVYNTTGYDVVLSSLKRYDGISWKTVKRYA